MFVDSIILGILDRSKTYSNPNSKAKRLLLTTNQVVLYLFEYGRFPKKITLKLDKITDHLMAISVFSLLMVDPKKSACLSWLEIDCRVLWHDLGECCCERLSDWQERTTSS